MCFNHWAPFKHYSNIFKSPSVNISRSRLLRFLQWFLADHLCVPQPLAATEFGRAYEAQNKTVLADLFDAIQAIGIDVLLDYGKAW